MRKGSYTRLQWALELLCAAFLVWMLAQFLLGYGALPDKIPTHFGADGVADAWGAKSTLQVLPIMGVMLYALLTGASLLPKVLTVNGAGPAVPVPKERMEWVRYLFLGPKLTMVCAFFWISRCALLGQNLGAFFTPLVLAAVAVSIFLPAWQLLKIQKRNAPG